MTAPTFWSCKTEFPWLCSLARHLQVRNLSQYSPLVGCGLYKQHITSTLCFWKSVLPKKYFFLCVHQRLHLKLIFSSCLNAFPSNCLCQSIPRPRYELMQQQYLATLDCSPSLSFYIQPDILSGLFCLGFASP